MTENMVLFIYAQRALLQQWQGKRLLAESILDSPATSRDQLAEIITANPNAALTVVVDTPDEELRSALIPKVMGSSRSQLMQRTLLQAFPNTKYRALTSQGVVQGQRRDEKLLLMAITQDDSLGSWVALLNQLGALVQRVTTASMVLTQLARQLRWKDEYQLLVYRHQDGGLRQLFLHNGHAGLSRLSMTSNHSDNIVGQFASEAAGTRQYLNNSKALPRTAELTVRVLHRDHMGADLAAGLNDLDQVNLQLGGISELAKQLSLKLPAENLRADHLLGWSAANFAHKLPEFAGAETHQRHRGFVTGQWLTRAAIIATAAMIVWSATELFAVWEISRRSDEQQMLLARWQQLEQDAIANMPPTVAAPLTMKQAIEEVQQLRATRRFPERALRQVAAALARNPQLRFRKIEWAAPGRSLALYDEPPANPDEIEVFDEQENPAPAVITETLFLELQIEPFSGDYLAALNQAEQAMKTLQQIPGVVATKMVSEPLNVDSQNAFSEQIAFNNSATRQNSEARFQLVISLASPPIRSGETSP